jgi:hypothetical protein
VQASDLAAGTATLLIQKNGAPLQRVVVGLSFDIIPPAPSTEVLFARCCKQYHTDCDGIVNVTFTGDANEMVRINVNINLGTCSPTPNCTCIRLTECLSPPTFMGACPLAFLGQDQREQNRAECCNC